MKTKEQETHKKVLFYKKFCICATFCRHVTSKRHKDLKNKEYENSNICINTNGRYIAVVQCRERERQI